MKTILTILWVVCAIWCVLDLFKKNITLMGKIIMVLVIWCFPLLGVVLYYFWARHHIEEWFK